MPRDGGTGRLIDSMAQARARVRSAERRRCPKCGRGSALRDYHDDDLTGVYCYWIEQGKCDYKDLRAVKMDWEA